MIYAGDLRNPTKRWLNGWYIDPKNRTENRNRPLSVFIWKGVTARHLFEVIGTTQRERFEYDPSGLRNQVADSTRNGWYAYTDATGTSQCQRVNLRFMGLFDTVLSVHRGSYNLGIPEVFSHVAHAVAMNEYRNLFPVESIAQGQFSSTPVPGQVRIERGFLGAHSDIGGGFADGDLAKVALVWMVNQATAAGVQMDALTSEQTTIIANPVIHDSSSNLYASTGPAPTIFSEDRVIRFRDGSTPRQRTALVGTGTGYQDTVPFISYSANPRGNVAGTVDMNGYLQWLNGYGINMTVQ